MMVSRIRATVATLVGGSANTLIVSIQAVVVVPLLLHFIGPKLYGAWVGSGDILVWLQALDLGLPNLMIQRIGAAHGRQDVKSVAEYYAAGMLTLGIVSLVLMLVTLGISFPLPSLMGLYGTEADTLRSCFILGGLAAALNVFVNSVVGFSRGIQNTSFMNATTIVASLVGFGVTLGLVLSGYGLWAIAIGLLVRSTILLLGGLSFTWFILRGTMLKYYRIKWPILREFLVISPVTALGGISYAAMNQSEAAIVSIFLRPELAAVLKLTRTAIDLARSLVDMIGVASYGGFAHLASSDQRQRVLQVHAEIDTVRQTFAIAMACAYMVVNPSLVSVWVGNAQYGGALLTILMALQFLVVGESYLLNYLYRATGPIVRGSVALFVEAAIRVPLMIALVHWIGLLGIPIAGIITSAISGIFAYRWTLQRVSSFATRAEPVKVHIWIIRIGLLFLSAIGCVILYRQSWVFVILAGTATFVVTSALFILLDPLLYRIRAFLMSIPLFMQSRLQQ
jgi:O-antigen/teichoic acid export membrane protein